MMTVNNIIILMMKTRMMVILNEMEVNSDNVMLMMLVDI